MATSKSSKRDKAAERRALVEKMKREQKRQERRRMILGTSVLVVILAVLVVGVVLGTRGGKGKPQTDGKQILPAAITTGQTSVQKQPATVENTTGVDGVIAYDTKGYPAPGKADSGTLGHDHVTGPVKYAVTPPVGGQHNGIWMNAGVYNEPIPSERAVHNLEHGAVWITYDSTLSASDVDKLVAFVDKQSMIDEGGTNSNRYMDLSPWDDANGKLPSKIVLSSWGYQLRLDSIDTSRMQDFVDTFRHNQKYTPEFGAAVDGVPVQTGGQPVRDGSKFANPAGAAQ